MRPNQTIIFNIHNLLTKAYVFTEETDRHNLFRSQKSAPFASKTGSYTRRFSPKYRSFPKIAPTKIAKMKTYHEPNNTMASNIKVMNWV